MSGGSSAARGVAILLSKDFEFKIHDSTSDNKGNIVIADLTISGLPRLTLAAIYAPNKDSPLFFKNIWEKIGEFGNTDVVTCGDWNVVRNYSKDTYNYARFNNPKAKEEIDRGIERLELVDVWREKNVDRYQITWGVTNPMKRARLDYFLVSQAIFNITEECRIDNKYRSDHAPVRLDLIISKQRIGPRPLETKR